MYLLKWLKQKQTENLNTRAGGVKTLIPNGVKDVGQMKSHTLLVGMQNGILTLQSLAAVSYVKHTLTTQPSNCTP
jgi:hypothetical protein